MTSVEFNSVHYAIMLCHFGQAWSSYVAVLFILRGTTATSSATGDYVAVSERFGQNEEPAGINEERTRNKRVFVPSSGFNRRDTHVNMIFSPNFTCFILHIFDVFFNMFLLWKVIWSVFILVFFVSMREKAFGCPFPADWV